MLLHSETSASGAGVILKRSARKFYDAAMQNGWSISFAINTDSSRVTIDCRDLDTALLWEPDNYRVNHHYGPTVRVVGVFEIDSGALYDSDHYTVHLRKHYDYKMSQAERDAQPFLRGIERHYGSDEKLQDLLRRLHGGPVSRKLARQREAQAKADAAAQEARHEALRNARLAHGDSEIGKTVRVALEALVAEKPETLDLSAVGRDNYQAKLDQFKQARSVAAFANQALEKYATIMGEFPNERALTIEEAAALVADWAARELVYEKHADVNANKARRTFVEKFHPRYGKNTDLRGVQIP